MSVAKKSGLDLPIIDFHSHILPKMDDGSRNVEMSLRMLQTSADMGVEIMVATPHFYGHRESRDNFLRRRDQSWAELSEALSGKIGFPKILLGAEVAFNSHILKHPELDELCISGTRVLLLELPFASWSEYELDGVTKLSLDCGYQVVLVHFERFLGFPGNEDWLERMLELPILLQMNGGSLLKFRGGKWAAWFQDGRASLLGSDCHNMDSRPPNLGTAREKLKRKAGPDVLGHIDRQGAKVLAPVLSEVHQ